MTNDEINRYIYTEIMGKCWHDVSCVMSKYGGMRFYHPKCQLCGHEFGDEELQVEVKGSDLNPDYCSDESPRSLLNEVLLKIAETGVLARAERLTKDIASTETGAIARACVEAWKNK